MFVIFKFCYTFSNNTFLYNFQRDYQEEAERHRVERKAARVCDFPSNIVCVFEKSGSRSMNFDFTIGFNKGLNQFIFLSILE